MKHNKSNSRKSKNGYNLNKEIKEILLEKLENNKIKDYKYEPKYNFPGYDKSQFSPDGEILLNNGTVIIIDNTTSARHDRFKQKQWDAYGVKKYFNVMHPELKTLYYVILPDKNCLGNKDNKEKEYKNYLREKAKCHNANYYSEIDDILHISELISLIDNQAS